MAFDWQGQIWQIVDTGRQWLAEEDEVAYQYYLVRTGDGSTFELCLELAARRWRLKRAWRRPQVM